jgi:cyanophycinase
MRPRIGSVAVAVLAGLLIVSAVGFGQAPVPSEPKPAAIPAVAATSSSKGTLLLVGGGTIPDPIRQRFVELAGGPAARVLVIPASPDGDEQRRAEYALAPWRALGVGTFDLLHARSREEADDPAFLAPIDQATGIWFGGGQQGWLAERYVGTLLQQRVRDLLARGGTVGGTSAGAAIASRVMIAGGRGQPQEGTGLGFLDDVVIDQHFLRRNRVDRLLAMIALHPDQVGVGIDESTAVVISMADRKARILGESYVGVCGGAESEGLPRMRFFQAGDELAFDEWKRAEAATAAAGGGR